MKYLNFLKILICIVAISSCHHVFADDNIFEMTIEQNLATPQIKKSNIEEKIRAYQHNIALELVRPNYDVELMRNNEVIIVTITADQLFSPNDTSLTEEGKNILKPMFRFLNNHGFYKMLLSMHSDNTGTERYAMNMSRSRVNSVYDWFAANCDVNFLVPYARGCKDPSPLTQNNNSMENRRLNRRLEIYLVPNDGMIEQAKHGSINISAKTK